MAIKAVELVTSAIRLRNLSEPGDVIAVNVKTDDFLAFAQATLKKKGFVRKAISTRSSERYEWTFVRQDGRTITIGGWNGDAENGLKTVFDFYDSQPTRGFAPVDLGTSLMFAVENSDSPETHSDALEKMRKYVSAI